MFCFDGIKAQPIARVLRAFTTCPSLGADVFNDIFALRVAQGTNVVAVIVRTKFLHFNYMLQRRAEIFKPLVGTHHSTSHV